MAPPGAQAGPRAALQADPRSRLWRGGPIALGGTPWGVLRLGPVAAALLGRAIRARPGTVTAQGELEQQAADRLIGRGLLHPVFLPGPARPRPNPAPEHPSPVPPVTDRAGLEVVVPAYGRPDLLDRCLASLRGYAVTVVDDASPTDDVAALAGWHGARLIRHRVNQGPAAARNTGLRSARAAIVAFLDADCVAPPGWADRLARHFTDPRVGAVAPRVVPGAATPPVLARHESVIARHERTRSALDLGSDPALVRPGGYLGFLPSAALLVRREALNGNGFDERLRLGEDVDLVWRLSDEGWRIRYDPTVVVEHAVRDRPVAWARRRFEYGTSAADLSARHPGRLSPLRPSPWNLAALAALAAGRPRLATMAAGAAVVGLGRPLRQAGIDPTLAGLVVGKGLTADALAIGHVLRREWWPLGWMALARSPSSRLARLAAVVMIAPVALEWLRNRSGLDPFRYTALRLAEDMAYGSGVIASAVRRRRPDVLLPQFRRPEVRGASHPPQPPRPVVDWGTV